jgi:hypothetical protein
MNGSIVRGEVVGREAFEEFFGIQKHGKSLATGGANKR